MNYYNEWDKGAAAWLRELIKAGHIPPGIVDERSITEVSAGDLAGFTQCHFFCGIGGWPLALHMAGYGADRPLWTGSPPCQPFSVAGKQLGQLDERHLAPAFMRLVDQCHPPVLFGEQVAAAIGKHWLDDLFTELERQGYACGAAVLPAASVGAPHKRDRLFFGASLGDTSHFSQHRSGNVGASRRAEYSDDGGAGGMADTRCDFASGETTTSDNDGTKANRPANQLSGCSVSSGRVADTATGGRREEREDAGRSSVGDSAKGRSAGCSTGSSDNAADPHYGFWSDADWLGCRDGKFRPVRSGTFPLANGIPARVGRLRGYGNAIVPQVAAEFIKAFEGAITGCKGTSHGS